MGPPAPCFAAPRVTVWAWVVASLLLWGVSLICAQESGTGNVAADPRRSRGGCSTPLPVSFNVSSSCPVLLPPRREITMSDGSSAWLPPVGLALLRNHRRRQVSSGESTCGSSLGSSAALDALTVVVRSSAIRGNLPLAQERVGLFVRDTCFSPLVTTHQLNDVLASANYSLPVAIANGVTSPWIVLGPSLSDEVQIISPQLSARRIPHLSHRATSGVFENKNLFPYLFRTVPSDGHQTRAIGDLLVHYGWSYIGLVASGDSYGLGGLDSLRREAAQRNVCIGLEESFSSVDARHVHSIVDRIADDESMRVLVLFALEDDARQFLACLLAKRIQRNYTLLAGEDWVTRISLRDVALNPDCASDSATGDARPAAAAANATVGRTGDKSGESAEKGEADTEEEEEDDMQLPNVIGFFPKSIGDEVDANFLASLEEQASSPEHQERIPWLVPYLENLGNCSIACQNRSLCDAALNCSKVPAASARCKWPTANEAIHLRPLLSLLRIMQRSVNVTRAAEVYGNLASLMVPCQEKTALLFPTGKSRKAGGGAWLCRAFTDRFSAWPLYHLIHHVGGDADGATDNFRIIGSWENINVAEPHLTFDTDAYSDTYASVDRFPASQCSLVCAPGERRRRSSSLVAPCSSVCWGCEECPDLTMSGGDWDECQACPSNSTVVTVVDSKKTACVIATVVVFGFSSSYGIAALATVAVSVVLLVVTLVLLWTNQKSSVVRTCDLKLSTFILVGFILALLSSLLAFTEPSATTCFVFTIVPLSWFTFVTTTMLAKISRIKHIFSKHSLRRGKTLSFNTTVQFNVILICGLTLVSFLILLVSSLVDEPVIATSKRDSYSLYKFCEPSEEGGFAFVAYLVALVVYVFVMALRSRNVPERYNESYHIFISTFGSLMVIFSLLATSFIASVNHFMPILFAFGLELHVLMAWTCVFAPRIYYLLRMKLRHETEMHSSSDMAASRNSGHRASFSMRLDNRTSFHLRRMAINDGPSKSAPVGSRGLLGFLSAEAAASSSTLNGYVAGDTLPCTMSELPSMETTFHDTSRDSCCNDGCVHSHSSSSSSSSSDHGSNCGQESALARLNGSTTGSDARSEHSVERVPMPETNFSSTSARQPAYTYQVETL